MTGGQPAMLPGLDGQKAGMPKKIIIIGGSHGAGKTVFARSFLPEEAACPRFINADLIAAGLSPFMPGEALTRAHLLMLEEIHACARRGESFAFETTLSGLGYADLIWKWQEMGYRVYLYFLSLASADIAVARVAERARQGGHDIHEEIVRRHYAAGLHNFDRYYRENADAWVVYDNSVEHPQFLEFGENPTRFIKKGWSETAWQSRLIEHANAPSWRPKTYNDLAAANDADLRGSHAALQRAAEMARQIAIQTQTSLVVSRKYGKLVRLTANRLKKQAGMALW
jgi:predicted ABC-type ATPase